MQIMLNFVILFLLCVSRSDILSKIIVKTCFHTDHTDRAFLQYVFACVTYQGFQK